MIIQLQLFFIGNFIDKKNVRTTTTKPERSFFFFGCNYSECSVGKGIDHRRCGNHFLISLSRLSSFWQTPCYTNWGHSLNDIKKKELRESNVPQLIFLPNICYSRIFSFNNSYMEIGSENCHIGSKFFASI